MKLKCINTICLQLFLTGTLFCQCPGIPFFKDRFKAIYQSSSKTSAIRLKGLLELQVQMKKCHFDKDSIYTLILQKTGLLYYLQSDFPKAIAYTQEAVQNAKDPSPGQAAYDSSIVQSYSNLTTYYDSLHQEKKMYDGIDSCITYAIKKNTAYDIVCPILIKKVAYLFNRGDYSLCMSNAALGEKLVKNYYHENDSIYLISSFVNFQANSLYISSKISLLENLLKVKEEEFTQSGNTNYLYVAYDLLGRINKDRKNGHLALLYFKRAYELDKRLKYQSGISENLDNIGMVYAKDLGQYD